ncbi:TetR family transcriptional regulator [Nocardioides flavescens]|uniref:TetR family transcriptional regulator n=1 Tax=Nocardioides flavescens TaxID=2691959 RepID=A0A6L7EWR9_9ACTN|nr:TetR family transcriptional regulator [Nocardioides flavescens]MXG88665.1 TetR family transcriptional regulator [Nocardioides flavescens]
MGESTSTQLDQRLDRRRRILDTAISLATDGGYDAVQMRAVAERSEVALGTLYRYFPSKVHLLVAAMQREFERAEARVRAAPVPGGTPADRVLHLLRTLSRDLQDDPHLTEALTRAFVSADASVADDIATVERLLTSMLTHAAHDAAPSPDQTTTARVVADVWLAALMGWVTGRTGAAEADARLEKAVRLLLPGPA